MYQSWWVNPSSWNMERLITVRSLKGTTELHRFCLHAETNSNNNSGTSSVRGYQNKAAMRRLFLIKLLYPLYKYLRIAYYLQPLSWTILQNVNQARPLVTRPGNRQFSIKVRNATKISPTQNKSVPLHRIRDKARNVFAHNSDLFVW